MIEVLQTDLELTNSAYPQPIIMGCTLTLIYLNADILSLSLSDMLTYS